MRVSVAESVGVPGRTRWTSRPRMRAAGDNRVDASSRADDVIDKLGKSSADRVVRCFALPSYTFYASVHLTLHS